MTNFSGIFATISLLTLSACGGSAEENPGNSADDFAARINGGEKKAPQGTVEPTVSQPKPGAAPGPFVPGTQTDPQTACGAARLGAYIGRQANDATRAEIVQVIAGSNEVRFVVSGSGFINPDPTHPRLNLMLDQGAIIRDVRCG